MSPRVQTDLKRRGNDIGGCYGFTMEDGTRYTANKQGSVEITNREHLKAIKAQGMFSTDMPTGFAHTSGDRYCLLCGFHGFSWQKKCPRDGGEMVSPEVFAASNEETTYS